MTVATIPALPATRPRRHKLSLNRRARWPRPVKPLGGQASAIMSDALWIEQITAAEAGEACRRGEAWVQGVVDGEIDPTLDELELALNAIGLETRTAIGVPNEPWPPLSHDPQRVADAIRNVRSLDMEMYGRVWVRREPPQPGATARQFGAGHGREDGGGRAALLIRRVCDALGITADQFGQKAGITPETARLAASGKHKPRTDDFERWLASNGIPMRIRIEPYCSDDDDEHAMWLSDPDGYEARISALRAEFQAATPTKHTRRKRIGLWMTRHTTS